MTDISALSEAQSTCNGLHKLIQRISQAAIDIEKGGSSGYEMHALIASANNCVINLSTQLTILESGSAEDANVLPIKRQEASVPECEPDHEPSHEPSHEPGHETDYEAGNEPGYTVKVPMAK